MLNEFVDQIYCINLEKRSDRREIFLNKLVSLMFLWKVLINLEKNVKSLVN